MNPIHNKSYRIALFAALIALSVTACKKDNTDSNSIDTDTTSGATTSSPFDQNGASHATFSVAQGKHVHFSMGNLQFSTAGSHLTIDGSEATGTFRFALHQYDYIGDSNANVSDSYEGFIDLLCWGSSGWHVSPCSEKDGDYDIESLTENESYADWGVFNAISNGGNTANKWRTLSCDEWNYLTNERLTSTVDGVENARYAEATVCNVVGLILLPDNFLRPAATDSIKNINANNFGLSYSDNIYNDTSWALMEQAGAIFLPAAGFRGGTWLSSIGDGGSYWASTCNQNGQAYALLFIDGLVNAQAECTYEKDRGYGRSVRLVKDAD